MNHVLKDAILPLYRSCMQLILGSSERPRPGHGPLFLIMAGIIMDVVSFCMVVNLHLSIFGHSHVVQSRSNYAYDYALHTFNDMSHNLHTSLV